MNLGDYLGSCAVKDCKKTPSHRVVQDARVPLCMAHAVKVWKAVDELNGKRMDAKPPEPKSKRDPLPANGDIYIARVGGLIKIGWSSRLYERIRSYGPAVEVLCHYPGTVQDEKALHHRFKPFLAKGREWFEEHQLISDYVDEMVAKHGKPFVRHDWTTPAVKPVKPRYWRGAA